MPTTATAAFTASSAGHRQEKQPVVRLQFHTGRASGLYVWRTAQKQYRLILDSSDMKYGGPTEKRQVAYRAKEENAMASHIGLHMHFRRMVWRCSASKIR